MDDVGHGCQNKDQITEDFSCAIKERVTTVEAYVFDFEASARLFKDRAVENLIFHRIVSIQGVLGLSLLQRSGILEIVPPPEP
ncbi:hypothetical protein Nepgr_017321 [Nepenthes gracilis]|uniref:Uncharacterized protein n=1 Tax=Nepenthes gracilis TaxID=150966 RepID=A0AAD3XT99_NEPGR|nr:hypothetical protein Nepgr_017321 [Nepenthes gracilis]